MPFPLGADVLVVRLAKRGRVVEVGTSGRYRVAVGGLTMWCREGDLAPAAGTRGKSGAGAAAENRAAATAAHPAPTERQVRELGSIDLHGLTVAEALEALEVRIDQAIRAGLDRLEIIHGISGGRLRAAVRGYLAGSSGIARFAPDSRNPGVTWVYF